MNLVLVHGNDGKLVMQSIMVADTRTLSGGESEKMPGNFLQTISKNLLSIAGWLFLVLIDGHEPFYERVLEVFLGSSLPGAWIVLSDAGDLPAI